jgi:tRNA(fMet)-specific endonuclease VapC
MAILPFPPPAIARFQRLAAMRLNVGRMDLRIAATDLEVGATLVTRNRRDFGRIPGLQIEDWSV